MQRNRYMLDQSAAHVFCCACSSSFFFSAALSRTGYGHVCSAFKCIVHFSAFFFQCGARCKCAAHLLPRCCVCCASYPLPQATVCARLGLQCIVYMGAKDMERQALNVFRMRLMGAEVRPVLYGTATLKDATSEAIRDWVTNVESTHYILGSAAGPHPYPMMVRVRGSVLQLGFGAAACVELVCVPGKPVVDLPFAQCTATTSSCLEHSTCDFNASAIRMRQQLLILLAGCICAAVRRCRCATSSL